MDVFTPTATGTDQTSAGADTFILGVDTSVDVDGGADETLDPGPNVVGTADVIDGGDGIDTLNWYAAELVNNTQRGTYSNIENINIYGSDFIGSGLTVALQEEIDEAAAALSAAQGALTAAQSALSDAVAELSDDLSALNDFFNGYVYDSGTLDPHPYDDESEEVSENEIAGDQSAIYNRVLSLINASDLDAELKTIARNALDSVQQYATNNSDGVDQDGAYIDDIATALYIASLNFVSDASDAIDELEDQVSDASGDVSDAQSSYVYELDKVSDSTIDAEFFAGSVAFKIDGVRTNIINLDEQTVTMTGGDVDNSLAYNPDITEANIILDETAGTIAVVGEDLTTVNLSGTTVGEDTIDLVDGSSDADDDTVTTLNVALAVEGDEIITIDLDDMEALETIDASKSTANIDWSDERGFKTFIGSAGDDLSVDADVTPDEDGFTVSVNTGTGNDEVYIYVDADGYDDVVVNVNTGDGDDEIYVDADTDVPATANINAGAGDDLVEMSRDLVDSDNFNGGAGIDTLSVDNEYNLLAGNYVRFNAQTGFEVLQFQNDVEVDASEVSGFDKLVFTDLDFFDGNYEVDSTVNNAVAGQLLLVAAGSSDGDFTVYADGYDKDSSNNANAGSVSIEVQAYDEEWGTDLYIYADSADITVNAAEAMQDVTVELGDDESSDLNSASITLASAYDADEEETYAAEVYVDAGNMGEDFTTLTIKGTGSAEVNNDEGGTLTTINASGLTTWVGEDGDVETSTFLYYSGDVQENIRVGNGSVDTIWVDSTAGGPQLTKMDTITGLRFTLNEAGDALAEGSDLLRGLNDLEDGDEFVVYTFDTTPGSLQAALNTVSRLTSNSESSNDNVVFKFGTATYIFQEAAAGTVPNGDFEAVDTVVKLVGTYDLDDLATALTLMNNPS